MKEQYLQHWIRRVRRKNRATSFLQVRTVALCLLEHPVVRGSTSLLTAPLTLPTSTLARRRPSSLQAHTSTYIRPTFTDNTSTIPQPTSTPPTLNIPPTHHHTSPPFHQHPHTPLQCASNTAPPASIPAGTCPSPAHTSPPSPPAPSL